jgi:hypothetical protein
MIESGVGELQAQLSTTPTLALSCSAVELGRFEGWKVELKL